MEKTTYFENLCNNINIPKQVLIGLIAILTSNFKSLSFFFN